MQRATTEDLQTFVDLFDGDVVAAAKELVAFAKDQQRPKTSKRELSGEIIVSVNDLKKTYKLGRQEVKALNGVTLNVHKGEFLALTGPSGSGKSTLLQLIGGLDKPTEGSVTVNGTNIAKMNDKSLSRFRNQTVGFVFQFFYLQPFLRLSTNLEVAGMPHHMSKADRQTRVKELAAAVGLEDRLRHYPRELSGGQMQRAAIARALLNTPSLILADEPTGNLDSENGRAVIELFQKIRETYGTTIVVVTHDPQIARTADREIRLKDGVVV